MTMVGGSCQVQVVSYKPRKLKHTYVNINWTFLNAVLCVPVLIMIISNALFDKNINEICLSNTIPEELMKCRKVRKNPSLAYCFETVIIVHCNLMKVQT